MHKFPRNDKDKDLIWESYLKEAYPRYPGSRGPNDPYGSSRDEQQWDEPHPDAIPAPAGDPAGQPPLQSPQAGQPGLSEDEQMETDFGTAWETLYGKHRPGGIRQQYPPNEAGDDAGMKAEIGRAFPHYLNRPDIDDRINQFNTRRRNPQAAASAGELDQSREDEALPGVSDTGVQPPLVNPNSPEDRRASESIELSREAADWAMVGEEDFVPGETWVQTPDGIGQVVSQDHATEMVEVEVQGQIISYHVSDLELANPPGQGEEELPGLGEVDPQGYDDRSFPSHGPSSFRG